MTQMGQSTVLQQGFQRRHRELMNDKQKARNTKLDLRQVILLDSQSTMDLFCNETMVSQIYLSFQGCHAAQE